MRERLIVTMREQQWIDVLARWREGSLTVEEAKALLGTSQRTARRLRRRFTALALMGSSTATGDGPRRACPRRPARHRRARPEPLPWGERQPSRRAARGGPGDRRGGRRSSGSCGPPASARPGGAGRPATSRRERIPKAGCSSRSTEPDDSSRAAARGSHSSCDRRCDGKIVAAHQPARGRTAGSPSSPRCVGPMGCRRR